MLKISVEQPGKCPVAVKNEHSNVVALFYDWEGTPEQRYYKALKRASEYVLLPKQLVKPADCRPTAAYVFLLGGALMFLFIYIVLYVR